MLNDYQLLSISVGFGILGHQLQHCSTTSTRGPGVLAEDLRGFEGDTANPGIGALYVEGFSEAGRGAAVAPWSAGENVMEDAADDDDADDDPAHVCVHIMNYNACIYIVIHMITHLCATMCTKLYWILLAIGSQTLAVK